MDSIFKNTAYKIFELFLEHPKRLFSIRGVARELDITHATVARYVVELYSINLLKRTNSDYPLYFANRKSEKFKEYQRIKALFDYHGKPPEGVKRAHKHYIL